MRTFLTVLCVACSAMVGWGATTINSANKNAYGANIGWLDWRGDTNSGAVIGEYVCSGFIYAANVGWISLGNGSPVNGIQYQNVAADDFGVNHDGLGSLRGLAYGASIGWIKFESTGDPKVDLHDGRLSGSIYSANCGWISLSNTFAVVQTDRIQSGTDIDGDGISDGWEFTYTNVLTAFTATSDADGDGFSDLSEHLADTNPRDASDNLRIISNSVTFNAGQDTDTVSWTSRPTRKYRLEYRNDLNLGFFWNDSGYLFGPDSGTTMSQSFGFVAPSAQRYFKVQALKPLP